MTDRLFDMDALLKAIESRLEDAKQESWCSIYSESYTFDVLKDERTYKIHFRLLNNTVKAVSLIEASVGGATAFSTEFYIFHTEAVCDDDSQPLRRFIELLDDKET